MVRSRHNEGADYRQPAGNQIVMRIVGAGGRQLGESSNDSQANFSPSVNAKSSGTIVVTQGPTGSQIRATEKDAKPVEMRNHCQRSIATPLTAESGPGHSRVITSPTNATSLDCASPVRGLKDVPIPISIDVTKSSTSGRHSHLERHEYVVSTSRLTTLVDASPSASLDQFVQEFILLPMRDMRRRANFLLQHPDIRDTPLGGILEEAVLCGVRGDSATSEKCIYTLGMLRMVDRLSDDELYSCFERMARSSTNEHRVLETLVGNVKRKVEKLVKDKLANPSCDAAELHMPLEDDDLRHGSENVREQFAYPTSPRSGIKADLNSAQSRLQNVQLKSTVPCHPSACRADHIYLGPESQRTEHQEASTRKLSPKFQIPLNGSEFFMPGRVFSVLWHDESTSPRLAKSTDALTQPGRGERLASNIVQGPYGELIYTRVRRMIVVRNRGGFCWCVSVGTYGGKGLSQRGLKRDEINAHAIIYDSQKEPEYLPREPKTTKAPIAVKVITGHSLNSATRVHYAKPYTVDWHAKVMNLGSITPECLPTFMSDVAYEILGKG